MPLKSAASRCASSTCCIARCVREPLPKLGDRRRREVGAAIGSAGRRKVLQQQSDPAADLQHPAGRQRRNPRDRGAEPLAHLVLGERRLRVAAVPADEVGSLPGPDAPIGLIEHRTPFAHGVVADPGIVGPAQAVEPLRVRHHIGDEPLAAGLILARNHHRLRHRRMTGQRRLDLARLDAEAVDLHLAVGAAEEVQRPVRRASAPDRRCGTCGCRAGPNGSATKRLGGAAPDRSR